MKNQMLAVYPYVLPELLIHFGYPRRNIRSELYSQTPFGSFLCDPERDIILLLLIQYPIEIKYAGRRITHCSISLFTFACGLYKTYFPTGRDRITAYYRESRLYFFKT